MMSIEPITLENALVYKGSFTGRTVPCANDSDRSEYEVARRL